MAEFVVEFGKDGRPMPPDGRLDASAFHRNNAPIWSVLAPFLEGRRGDVLEIGSGTGQHVVTFARQSLQITWWPSDVFESHLASIAAWRAHSGLPNVRPPLRIDASRADWEIGAGARDAPQTFLAIVCNNVLHISPWRVSEGLLAGAGRLLQPGGLLFVYGPFMRGGAHTAPSNATFDATLRAENSEWGVRDVDALARIANIHGLLHTRVVEMPANNLILVFERARG